LHPDVLTGPAWRDNERLISTEHHAIVDAMLKSDAIEAKEILDRHLKHNVEHSLPAPAQDG